MSAIVRSASNLLSAGNVSITSTGGVILFKTGVGATVRITVPNNGSPGIDIDGDCNLTAGNQYLVNGVPITTGGGTFVDQEVPAGAVDDVNVTFTLVSTPAAGTLHLYANGMLQKLGALFDYTLSGSTITFNVAPSTGTTLLASYRL